MRTDFIDYPTGWELQEIIGAKPDAHLNPECSAIEGPFLCDCGAIALEWIKQGGSTTKALSYVPEECKPEFKIRLGELITKELEAEGIKRPSIDAERRDDDLREME